MWPRSIENDVVYCICQQPFFVPFPSPSPFNRLPLYPPRILHTPTELEWKGRLKVERSLAVKCPSIGYHLVTAKKIQQAIAAPEVLDRFLDDVEVKKRLSRTFTGLYPLDDTEQGRQAILKVRKRSSLYALCSLSFLILSVCMEAELHSTLRCKITLDICVLGCLCFVCALFCACCSCVFCSCVCRLFLCVVCSCVCCLCVLIGCLCV